MIVSVFPFFSLLYSIYFISFAVTALFVQHTHSSSIWHLTYTTSSKHHNQKKLNRSDFQRVLSLTIMNVEAEAQRSRRIKTSKMS